MTERSATGEWRASNTAVACLPSIPGYEILGELGRGGMGVVYKARQLSPDRLVALKVIRDGALAGPRERARFRIEAEAAARVQHPNVIAIYEVGEHQGQPYFAMELVEGGSLDRHLAGQPQPAKPAAELIRTLALTIAHTHTQNVVHRDLKPANILLVSGGAVSRESSEIATHHSPLTTLTPKVSDFGLAKRLDTDSTALTQDGAILGTVGYMSPEQAAGRVQDVGRATDVYALGAILYELLTGRPPFRAETWNQTIEQVLRDEPVPPSRLVASVPLDLETICLKCLEKEPARRYAGAAAMADDLVRFLAGTPVAAVPLGERERIARLASRDGYTIVGEVGRGPRSVVYHALSGPLRQPVALKVFAADALPRDEWEARLRRWAYLWSALTHPQVVRVHASGWWDNAPYLAAEYVPHGSLTATLTGKPFPVRRALDLAARLAEIVCFLHRQGAVHGNLKPNNVLLAADGIPRVVDLRPTSGLVHGPFPANAAPGDVHYLAPELARDPDAEPRPYTDVYGVAIILYELLTGRPPFVGDTAREVLDQVCSREPDPPSRLNPEVTSNLDWFCLKGLRKDPWRRFSRAYDMLTRLRDLHDDPTGDSGTGSRRPRRPPPEAGR